MIKTYGIVRKFPDGEGGEIIFKASGNLYPLYKSFTGKDLMAAYDEYVDISVTNGKEIETKTGMTLDVFKALSDEEKAKRILSAKIKLYTNGADFVNSVMLAMFLNGLPQREQDEALAAGLDCLPYAFYTDKKVIESITELLIDFITGTKKNAIAE